MQRFPSQYYTTSLPWYVDGMFMECVWSVDGVFMECVCMSSLLNCFCLQKITFMQGKMLYLQSSHDAFRSEFVCAYFVAATAPAVGGANHEGSVCGRSRSLLRMGA